MKIQAKDQFHGSALTQIVEHESFKALNKATAKYGHYQINNDRRMLLKYSAAGSSPWQFTFNGDDLKTVRDDITAKHKSFICLVCGVETVCLLNENDASNVIDVNATTNQWITVELPPKASMRVKGSSGSLRHAIAHNLFPNSLFA